jgi:succinate dehydrogenase/fumarate reductase flavoprotein subunit
MKYDKETDVIVVGYGLAGAVSAVEAHDAGPKVLIVEKSLYPGGCSILSGGFVLCAANADEAVNYLSELSGGRVGASLIRSFAEGLAENEEHLRRLAEVNGGTVKAYGRKEEKAEPVINRYPFAGSDTFYTAIVQRIPGFSGSFPWVQRLQPAGVNLMKTLMDNVERRRIEVLLATPAQKLVTDASGMICGLIARNSGAELAVRARRAVILACGGFEHNAWLHLQYLQGKPFYSIAPLTHTGDGILMAQKVGAALWHMWHVHGAYGFKFPEFPIAFRHTFSGPRNPKRIMPWIVVDKFGTRYMNEYQPAPQDTGHRAMDIFDPDIPGYPRIPSFLIYDEAGRKRGRIAHPLSLGEHVYEWSNDNLEEVRRGWIVASDDLRELALKIREMKVSEGKMDADVLAATVLHWNSCVDKGEDWLRRPAGTMAPIATPPFYAVPVWPIISNTQGGPVHNETQQVMDAFGEPIPRLYCAGELGSFFAHLYQLSGNLGECVSSGRVAGRHAAAEQPMPEQQ